MSNIAVDALKKAAEMLVKAANSLGIPTRTHEQTVRLKKVLLFMEEMDSAHTVRNKWGYLSLDGSMSLCPMTFFIAAIIKAFPNQRYTRGDNPRRTVFPYLVITNEGIDVLFGVSIMNHNEGPEIVWTSRVDSIESLPILVPGLKSFFGLTSEEIVSLVRDTDSGKFNNFFNATTLADALRKRWGL